ncbi:unnamed protein product [Anisakis simplex]|uniref:Secreted protein n=1 Tax=Anisakis simplex TaxID=6269 RepID=A0A0M3JB71_ANISI|nr:unnamed protein product [Anisakis simplex]
MFCFSTLTVLAIFLLNMTLLSSIHAIGSSQIPFEIIDSTHDIYQLIVRPESLTIFQVCVAVNIRNRQITAKVDSKSREESSNSTMKYVCKPFWEDGGLGLGLHRQEAGPWQTRIKLSGRNILAISTQVRMNYTDRQNPHHQLLYDYAVLRRYTPGTKYVCVKGADSGWFVLFEYQ